ncbi:MAG: hypothetical protein HUU02_14695 [Bacteroidetes bacterium]|nr:hypothetical protein [Bacteroidota bacterium]
MIRYIHIGIFTLIILSIGNAQQNGFSVFIGYPALPWLYEFRQNFHDVPVIGDYSIGLGYPFTEFDLNGRTHLQISFESHYARLSSAEQFTYLSSSHFILHDVSIITASKLYVPSPVSPFLTITAGITYWSAMEKWSGAFSYMTASTESIRPSLGIRAGVDIEMSERITAAFSIGANLGIGRFVMTSQDQSYSVTYPNTVTSAALVSASVDL